MSVKIGIMCKKNDERSKEKSLEFYKKCSLDCYFIDEHNDMIFDYIVVFGGDGSVLRAIPFAIKSNAPIIAVNTGRLGFLCSIDNSDIDRFCEELQSGKIEFEQKTLLETEIGELDFLSFNDVIVQREVSNTAPASAIEFDLFLNKQYVETYISDGIIISTPIGSTAYSLSAGGAILTPDLNGFIVTAICPHSMYSRPIVFSDKNQVELFIKRSDMPCKVFSDGIFVGTIDKTSSMTCRKSDKTVFISKGDDYFCKLNEKLRNWGKRE